MTRSDSFESFESVTSSNTIGYLLRAQYKFYSEHVIQVNIMDQVIIFDKSCEERLQEYTNVLSKNAVLSASQIRKEWCNYLEMVVDYAGWQAVWKIPRINCEDFKIPYPTVVLAYIDQVDFDNLSASVKILAVQDDINLPEHHVVPLIQLWPTQQQDDTVSLNLIVMATAIDMFRVFYNHLWMPWDTEDDDTVDWLDRHLEKRLRLYYDMKLGIVPRKTAERLRSLLTEANKIQAKREYLEEQLEDDSLDSIDSPQDAVNENVQTLMAIHMRLMQIKNEFEILENPVLRTLFIQKVNKSKHESNLRLEINYWLIFQENLGLDDYIDYVQQVKSVMPANQKFKTASSFHNATETALPNDVLIVGAGKHSLLNIGAFEEGGVIRAVSNDRTKTIIASSNEGTMFDFFCEKMLMENLSLDASHSQHGIVIRKGHITLTNCKLSGNGNSSIQQGVIVLNGSTLVLENCEVTGFNTGIVANSGSKVIIKNSKIAHVDFGLKFYDNTSVRLENTIISDCEEYGVSVETESEALADKHTVCDLALLTRFCDISESNCIFASNKLGDVILNKKMKIVPVCDLFSNPTYNNILNYTTYAF